MTTVAQVQTAYQNFQTQLDGLLNTAVDKLNPDKATTPQIIAIINTARTQLDLLATTALASAQALGVI